MKLKSEDYNLIRNYMHVVDGIIARYVPNPVPGVSKYNQMMKYLALRKEMLNLFSPLPEVKSKWKQIDLEDAIWQEKKIKKDLL